MFGANPSQEFRILLASMLPLPNYAVAHFLQSRPINNRRIGRRRYLQTKRRRLYYLHARRPSLPTRPTQRKRWRV